MLDIVEFLGNVTSPDVWAWVGGGGMGLLTPYDYKGRLLY